MKRMMIVAAMCLMALAGMPARAQQVTGTLGSPSATTTIPNTQLPPPDPAARLAIFKVHTRGRPLAGDVDLAELAGAASEGQSGADIELACRNASLAAIREYLAIHQDKADAGEHLAIRMEHFRAAVRGTGVDR